MAMEREGEMEEGEVRRWGGENHRKGGIAILL